MAPVCTPVRRVLVVDPDDDFLALAVGWFGGRYVAVDNRADQARRRCNCEQFDLVICELYLDTREETGADFAMELHAETKPGRRIAVVSYGLDVSSALVLARVLPPEIIVRAKGRDVLDSILLEAETGEAPSDYMGDANQSFERARRELARRMVARAGNNKSEAARRLDVHRTTLVKYSEPSEVGPVLPRRDGLAAP